jgi:hypothetical protein
VYIPHSGILFKLPDRAGTLILTPRTKLATFQLRNNLLQSLDTASKLSNFTKKNQMILIKENTSLIVFKDFYVAFYM